MGDLRMSEKERQRKALMEMVKQKQVTLVKAAKHLNVSYRQAKRIYGRYVKAGDEGLVHQHRGRISHRRHPERVKILMRYQERYWDFGPTLAAEKLAEEDGLAVDHETLRRWLIQEQLWHRQRKRSPHRQRRLPKAQFGELLQLDGSFHDWFEDGEPHCLMNLVDDATSHTLARLETAETTAGVFRLLWQWIETYGVPMALYVDLKTVYVAPKSGHLSHVEKACQKLGIRVIKAYSPQAKGRVERKHGVYQDRFIKELRLANIRAIPAANEFLHAGYIDKLNDKFAKPARHPVSAHRPFSGDLNQILCWEYARKVQNDWTISFLNHYYQIQKKQPCAVKPQCRILVRQHLNGTVSLWYQNQPLAFDVLPEKPQKKKTTKLPISPTELSLLRRQAGKIGKSKSPWRHFHSSSTHRTQPSL